MVSRSWAMPLPYGGRAGSGTAERERRCRERDSPVSWYREWSKVLRSAETSDKPSEVFAWDRGMPDVGCAVRAVVGKTDFDDLDGKVIA
jgi:hypothetical protein